MDLTRAFSNFAFRMWVAEFVVAVFLVFGAALLIIGLCLIFNGAATLRFFGGMNRWVSTRRATKPLEIPRNTQQAVQKYRRWLAVLFVAGGLFALYGLVTRFDPKAVIYVLRLSARSEIVGSWLIESVRWILIVGNLAGIAVGVLLGFFPQALSKLEAGGGKWYSERQFAKGRETPNYALDALVMAFPRAAGCIIALCAVFLIAAFGLILPTIK